MNNDLLYQIALTKIPNIGHVHAKMLIRSFENAEQVFNTPRNKLEKIDGIGFVRANCIKAFKDYKSCEHEIEFIKKNNIQPLFVSDNDYPKRLLNCYDAPVLLYFKGNISLNKTKVISVIGTRSNSEYGKNICEKFIADLSKHDITIISGLAYGIDSIAHKSAIKHNLSTVAVLAHGLDRIYPYANKKLSEEITEQGGLLTEYTSGTIPDKQNFPGRNRITAGICDALVIIETGKTGGSLITAELANGYNKDVFAVPGRVSDPKSEGCNNLIKNNKACLITKADDLLEIMNWEEKINKPQLRQRELFFQLTADESKLVAILKEVKEADIDTVTYKSAISYSAVACALLSLELNGIIQSMPGKRYKLIDADI